MGHKLFDQFLKLLKTIYHKGDLNTNLFWDDIKEGDELYNEERRIIEKRVNSDPLTGDHDLIDITYTQFFISEFKEEIYKIEMVIDDLDIVNTPDYMQLSDFFSRVQFMKESFNDLIYSGRNVAVDAILKSETEQILKGINEELQILCDYMKARIDAINLKNEAVTKFRDQTTDMQFEKLKFNLSVEEIACFFRLLMEAKIIDETNKTKVARVVTKAFSSATKPDFDEANFRNELINCIQKSEDRKKVDNVNTKTLKSVEVNIRNLLSKLVSFK